MTADPGAGAGHVVATMLFTDIVGSSRLWEEQREPMREAVSRHDALSREVVARHGGTLVKMSGDGVHAAFQDPASALAAAIDLQTTMVTGACPGLRLSLRCGLHLGAVEPRDGDYYGPAVNRAARVMGVAHADQVLLTAAVEREVRGRLPPGVSLSDLGQVRLRDLALPERVFQACAQGLPQVFPPPRSLESTPGNLPQQWTELIGREGELASLASELARTRLLTLIGPGGIGKTRLALQLAADRLEDFPDGLWLVELDGLSEQALVPQQVANVLGVREAPGRPLIDSLVAHLAERRLLLVLDNCEHLLDACARLASRVLQGSSSARILATSREPLRVPGEVTSGLAPLGFPAAQAVRSARDIAHFPAVRLFVERARAAQPAFELGDAVAGEVALICRQLDGLPLALELAAARARSMSMAQLASRLSDRFRLLTAGARSAMPRQQTLQHLIGWSHDLLEEAERQVMRRLAVMAGSFSVEAAEAVAAEGEVDEAEVLPLLGQLVDKSLLGHEGASGRYRFLESVRHFAEARLREAGEADAMRDRHLLHFADRADEWSGQLHGPAQRATLAALDADQANLVAAHERACTSGHGGVQALRLFVGLSGYLHLRGLSLLALRQARLALSLPDAQQAGELRARALLMAGQHASTVGRWAEARSLLLQSLEMCRALELHRRAAIVLQPLGEVTAALGDVDEAVALLEQSQDIARRTGDGYELMSGLTMLGQLLRLRGDPAGARVRYEEALRICRRLGEPASVLAVLINLTMLDVGEGRLADAAGCLREALGISSELDAQVLDVCLWDAAGALATAHGDLHAARQCFASADRLAASTGYRRDPADERFRGEWSARLEHLRDGGAVPADGSAPPQPEGWDRRTLAAWLQAA